MERGDDENDERKREGKSENRRSGRIDRGTIVVIKRVEGRVALVSHPPSAPLHSIHTPFWRRELSR